MPDDYSTHPHDSVLRLEPPVSVPDPAPLDMPRRRLRLLPFDLARMLPGAALGGRTPENSRAG